MNPQVEPRQRIARLAPLGEILAAIESCAAPVAVRQVPTSDAAGCVLAADVFAPVALPPAAVAVRDGWAVRADLVADAGPYAPVPLTPAPPWVDAGDLMPADADAVLPPEALAYAGSVAEAIAPVSPGEGAMAAGFETATGALLRSGGARLRALDVALLRAAGVSAVGVRRPRVAVVAASVAAASDIVTPVVAAAVAAQGGEPVAHRCAAAGAALQEGLNDHTVDAVITIGGTGEGRNDRTAHVVGGKGRLLLHGMGIRPGETAGLGVVGERPVLMLPGRLDAALAVWLAVGRAMVTRLSGASVPDGAREAPLLRKIASSVGLAEIVLVRSSGEAVEPVAAGAFSLRALAQADGWVLVPAESEGYPAGATVSVNPLL